MKVAVSYSGGKESALALYRAIQQGHEPVLLITTFNLARNHSYSHGIDETILSRVSDALGIPSLLVKTTDKEYTQDFEKAMREAKTLGAEGLVFGDIDIPGHREWGTERCQKIGLKAIYPLWGEERKNVVYEFIESGFVANITVVNTKYLKDDFVGQQLTKEMVDDIALEGADICGENGEYHTFVSAGPCFKHPVSFTLDKKIKKDEYVIMFVSAEGSETQFSYRFFHNPACQYFPCHATANPNKLNCLLCFCPLYARGNQCGGKFTYTEKGLKSCKNCELPHQPEYYDTVIAKLKEWGPGKC